MFNRSTLFCVLMLVGAVACAPVTTRVPKMAPVAGAQNAAPEELTCGSLGPSTDPDAIARVGALFSRPDNVTQLLHNLKLAYFQDLFIQAGFYADANLTKFFAGTKVKWGNPRPLTGPGTSARDITVTSDDPVFSKMTITILRGCFQEFRHVSSHYSEVYALSVSAHLVLRVNTVPGFTVAATRGVFGENSGGLDLGYINDEFGRPDPIVIKHKGALDYEEELREKSPDSKISRNVFSFVIGQNPHQTALEAAQLNDSDRVENVEILQRGR